MNYLIYDESGAIVQSNKVYDHEGYSGVLNERNMKHVAVNSPTPMHMDEWYVSKNELTGRPDMPCFVERPECKAGGDDAVRISGLPKPCKVSVTVTGGLILASSELVETGYIELPSPIPTTFTILIEQFPYRPRTIMARAI